MATLKRETRSEGEPDDVIEAHQGRRQETHARATIGGGAQSRANPETQGLSLANLRTSLP